ncbi:hypothetical protein MNBD_DELTA03-829 [hydrothermal vent metagenome]|uniref:Uncharacterized protein n=1 Tax=hydrothermal vent metagenome TaxID=652676 RepID=A0A3B0VJL9_9ZZZZ
MAERKFKLPGINNLSKEQEAARSLPKKGQYLITGGPGTGKSILALLRCRRHARDREDYIFLVFNHLLNQASGQLFADSLNSRQWQSWFLKIFHRLTGRQAPKKPANKSGFRDIDWDQSLEIIQNSAEIINEKRPYLIIDEGQDMPPQFYQALAELGFENFYVVADDNQQITLENSRIDEIQNILCLTRDDIIELKTNYRNTYPTARLAREFCLNRKKSPPALPAPQKDSIIPLFVKYDGHRKISFSEVIKRILKEADRSPSRLIGIITANNKVRERYYEHLKSTAVSLDNTPRIATYAHGSKHNLAFKEGGILVINANSCKGLEFNTVYLTDLDQFSYWPEIKEKMIKLFYVIIARAIDRVILLRQADKPCPIAEIIPRNPNIIERR